MHINSLMTGDRFQLAASDLPEQLKEKTFTVVEPLDVNALETQWSSRWKDGDGNEYRYTSSNPIIDPGIVRPEFKKPVFEDAKLPALYFIRMIKA